MEGRWGFLLMEFPVVFGLGACRFVRSPGILVKPPKPHRRISNQLGHWAFTALFSFWSFAHCSSRDRARAPARTRFSASARGGELPAPWRGGDGAGAWAGPGLGVDEDRTVGFLEALQGGSLLGR